MGGSYTDLPDLEAYENYSSAPPSQDVISNIQGTYGNYLFIDLGVYARSSPQDQGRAEETLLARAGEKSPEARAGMQRLLDVGREGATLDTAGGGTIINSLDVAVMDDRTLSLRNRIDSVYGRGMSGQSPEQEQIYYEFTRHHENAHLMLNLKEPGSDFVAAVTLLRQHPEARDTLQTISDLRIVDGFKDGPAGLARYGAESHEALQRALSMTPEQIQNTSMTTLHAIALEYDEKNQMNRVLMEESPEGKVLTALDNRITGGVSRGSLTASWEVAASYDYETLSEAEKNRQQQFTPAAMRQALAQTDLTGEARSIANETISAIDRLDATVGGTPQPAPAQRPAPAQP